MTEPTTHIALMQGEDDGFFVLPCSPGDYEDTEHTFEADVPSALMTAVDEAMKAYNSAVAAVVEAAGVDEEMLRLKECCAEWQGNESPPHVSYAVTMPGRSDEWPLNAHGLTYFDEPGKAEAYIADLPEEFLLHSGAWPLAKVRRDELFVERGGWRGSVSTCHRCGWERDEHPKETA